MGFVPFNIEPSWKEVLKEELAKPYITELAAFVEHEREVQQAVYPPKDLVFNAFWQTPFNKVKVVVVGQDPYHGQGQAHGLSFSVPKGIQPPPSLKNIYKELMVDVGITPPEHGCLLTWASQGVLLLNAVLTVRHSEASSHKGRGWERFTDAAIEALSLRDDPLIFLLWGRFAQDKCLNVESLTSNSKHVILKTTHPSPFSAHNGFLGCRHFSKVNETLKSWGKDPINWEVG